MVSKVVIFAFVALCCAQALAAPREDKMELESAHLEMNIIKCTKAVIKVVGIVKDAVSVVSEYKSIVTKANKAKAACKAVEDATSAEIEECTEEAKTTEINDIISETKSVVSNLSDVYEKIMNVVDECT